jgi:hypothetical protein
MWSKNPMPVDRSARPVPSRFTVTVIAVSAVVRAMVASLAMMLLL